MTTKKHRPLKIFSDFTLDFIPSATFPVEFSPTYSWANFKSFTPGSSTVISKDAKEFCDFYRGSKSYDRVHYSQVYVLSNGDSTRDTVFTPQDARGVLGNVTKINAPDRSSRFARGGCFQENRVFIPRTSLEVPDNEDKTALSSDLFIKEINSLIQEGFIEKNYARFYNIDKDGNGYIAPIPDLPSLKTQEDKAEYCNNLRKEPLKKEPYVVSFLNCTDNNSYTKSLSSRRDVSFSHSFGYRKLLEVLGFFVTINTAASFADKYGDMPLKEVVKQEDVDTEIRKLFSTLSFTSNDITRGLLECFGVKFYSTVSPLHAHNVKKLPTRDVISELPVNSLVDIANARDFLRYKKRKEENAFSATQAQKVFYDRINDSFPPSLKNKKKKIEEWVEVVAKGAEHAEREKNAPAEDIQKATNLNARKLLTYADMRARQDILNLYKGNHEGFKEHHWEGLSSASVLSPMSLWRDDRITQFMQIANILGAQYVLHHMPLHHLYMLMRIVCRGYDRRLSPVAKKNISWYCAVAEEIIGKEKPTENSNDNQLLEKQKIASHTLYHLSRDFFEIGFSVRDIRNSTTFSCYTTDMPMETMVNLFTQKYVLSEENSNLTVEQRMEREHVGNVEKIVEEYA